MMNRKRGRRYKRNIKHLTRKVVFIGTRAPYIWGITRKEGRKMEVSEAVARLEEIRETMAIQRDTKAVEWLNESIRIMEEQAERIAIMAEGTPDGFPVAEIKKGHMRLAHKEESDGIIVCFCVAEEYGEPGTTKEDKTPPVPVVGLKLWGTKNARLIAESFVAIADEIDERRSNERS